jgi:ribonuclease D
MFDLSEINYVADTSALDGILPILEAADRIALDTEADSLHHYFEKVCLIQISTNRQDIIVDPLSGVDLKPMFEILAGKKLIIHGADYDLRMLRRDFNFSATSIFDTMTAAQLLGYSQIGYAALVEKHLGVVLSKHGQKADWSVRPLPEKLVHYASADTHFLFDVAREMETQLEALGRGSWHGEICSRLLETVAEGNRLAEPDKQWRIKGWHSLKSPRAWGYLRELWQWRDQEAQRADFPPFKILRNETLIELAAWGGNGSDPAKMPRLPQNIKGRRRRFLEQAIEQARVLPDADLPKPLASTRRTTPPPSEEVIQRLKAVRDSAALRLNLDSGIVLPVAALGAIAITRPQSENELVETSGLYNWQIRELGSDILKAVQTTGRKKS